jgi:predicted nucleic acid-binding protein
MKLVVDANIIISALISSRGRTRELLLNDSLELYSPRFLEEELEEHKDELIEKTGLDGTRLDSALKILLENMDFVSMDRLRTELRQAEAFSPDPDDIQYLALALHYSCILWSNDKRLQKQQVVSVINTTELIDKIYSK